MVDKREYIIGIFEESVLYVLNGEKAFDDVEDFWLDMYLTKPKVFRKILNLREEEILRVTESIEKKKRVFNL